MIGMAGNLESICIAKSHTVEAGHENVGKHKVKWLIV